MFPAVTYTVELPVYHGPLDLLLQLIEHAELDITQVALAQVTDQYLVHLKQLNQRDPRSVAEFLVIASKLILIKSEALLPRPPVRAEGEEDPAEDLLRQLLAYRRFKEVAGHLHERMTAGLRTYLRTAPPPRVEPRLDLSNLSPDDLLAAFQRALAAMPEEQPVGDLLRAHRVTIRDKITLIVTTLRTEGRASFHDLMRRAQSRMEIVITFLALLELIKRRQVTARQERMFGDIEIIPAEAWDGSEEFELEFGE